MTYARIVTARFKQGKREEAMMLIDGFKGYADDPRGFQGIVALLSNDDPNVATLITTWDSQEALEASREGIFNEVMTELSDLLDGPPEVREQTLREMKHPGILHAEVFGG